MRYERDGDAQYASGNFLGDKMDYTEINRIIAADNADLSYVQNELAQGRKPFHSAAV